MFKWSISGLACVVAVVVWLLVSPSPQITAEEQVPRPAEDAQAYEFDPVHSMVHFRIGHLGLGYVYGRFNELTGNFQFDPENLAATKFEFNVKAVSVDTNHKQRDEHLRSPDFFNARQFPDITFKSAMVTPGQGENAYNVTGQLTMLGQSKTVTVPVQLVGSGKDPWGNNRAGFEATLTLDRTEFGMTYNPRAVGTEVRLMIAFQGTYK